MSFIKISRFVIGWVISLVLLVLILPHIGVPQSHFMPPASVYEKAAGNTSGVVINKHSEMSHNPFRLSDRLYYLDYRFELPPLSTPGAKEAATDTPVQADKPKAAKKAKGKSKSKKAPVADTDPATKGKSLVTYISTALVDPRLYDHIERGMPMSIRYEKTYPDINGITDPGGAQSSIDPNVTLSWNWLRWIFLSLVCAYIVMLILERFGTREDL